MNSNLESSTKSGVGVSESPRILEGAPFVRVRIPAIDPKGIYHTTVPGRGIHQGHHRLCAALLLWNGACPPGLLIGLDHADDLI